MRRVLFLTILSATALVAAACGGGGGGAATASAGAGRATASAGAGGGASASTGAGGGASASAGAGGGASASAGAGGGVTPVAIIDLAFQPAEVTVPAGGTVTWANAGVAPHTVKFDDQESPQLQTGGTYQRTFATAGSFAYICGLHPEMKGTVTVR